MREGRMFAWVAAVAVFVGAAWFALIDERVTMDAPPDYDPGFSQAVNLQLYYDWFDGTLAQERFDAAIAILGFTALIGVGLALGDRLTRDDGARSMLGPLGIALGSGLWIVGNVLQLGGHRAVGKMSQAGNALEPVNSIAFTVDTVDDWFELFAFAFLGVGALALAWQGRQVRANRPWTWLTAVTGVVFLALAGAYLSDNGDVIDPLLFVGGMLLLPAWLIWTAETMFRGEVPSRAEAEAPI